MCYEFSAFILLEYNDSPDFITRHKQTQIGVDVSWTPTFTCLIFVSRFRVNLFPYECTSVCTRNTLI